MTKYGAKKTEIDGYIFDSKAEASRYSYLLLLEKAGEISNLNLQPVFPLIINGKKIGKYIADFQYNDQDGNRVVEDVKGMATPVFRLKKKIVEAIYEIQIVEVR